MSFWARENFYLFNVKGCKIYCEHRKNGTKVHFATLGTSVAQDSHKDCNIELHSIPEVEQKEWPDPASEAFLVPITTSQDLIL